MPKKKKASLRDPVSRQSLIEGIIKLGKKNFSPWNPSPIEEAVFQIAEGLEQTAKGLRNLAAAGKLPK